MTSNAPRPRLLRFIGPGLLVAATGVGAGDLATGAFTGGRLGVAVLWAVLVGAFLKFVLNEGLARWQIATGETLLEGALRRVARPWRWLFLLYLLPWTWFVGSALISACGAASHALVPVFDDAPTGKTVFGIVCSIVGLVLVELGGYRVFEKVMRVCICVMFVTTVVTAALMAGDAWPEIGRGLVVPTIPDADGEGLGWTVALVGGIGGTLTVLCYGYWIREEGRDGPEHLSLCRVDLATGYTMTALFGIAIVILGSQVQAEGTGAGLVVALGDRLGETLGDFARVAFLIGAWGAVFSSLLGVWQAVPYVFADFWQITRLDRVGEVDVASREYRSFLWAIAFVPMLGLLFPFRELQKAYAIVGAFFLPLLAVVLFLLNGRSAAVPAHLRNRPWTSLLLLATLGFFMWYGWLEVEKRWG